MTPPLRRRLPTHLLLALAAYPAFLAMMALHELGHVLHALLTGGHVTHVSLPLLDFSRTDVSPNPHPLVVAWGGPLWGSLLPLIPLLLTRRHRASPPSSILHPPSSPSPLHPPAQLFAGLCLISNGAYLALGPWMTAGDPHDLLRHGAPTWSLILPGTLALLTGLYLWHLATTRPPTPNPTP